MIHVATVHFRSEKWIDVQLRYLHRNLSEPFRVVANLQGVPGDHASKYDRVIPARGGHPGKLNLMAAEIVNSAEPDDLIMFLDGDAFPVVDPMPLVRKALLESSLVAVRRDENYGDPQPHPCFAVVRVADWVRLRGDWTTGFVWQNSIGQECTDTGGNMLAILERQEERWTPLLRTNEVNIHPIWFAVYGGIVYHHGAGFREPMARSTMSPQTTSVGSNGHRRILGSVARRAREFQAKRTDFKSSLENARLGEGVYERLMVDPEFYRTV